jgi:hypothetical protein
MRISRPLPPQFRCVRTCPRKQPETPAAETKSEPVETTVPQEGVKSEETVPEPEVKEAESVKVEPEVSVPEEKKKELSPFEAKLVQLEDMGFVDREKNIERLVRNSGDLVRTIRELLE